MANNTLNENTESRRKINDLRIKMSYENKRQQYDEIGDTYDQDIGSMGYTGPAVTASILSDIFPENRDKIEIFDVAAGTGLVARKLREAGFRKIDGLDYSKGMLEEARKSHLYRTLLAQPLTSAPLDIPDNTYDAITCCGGFGGNCIQFDALHEMIRLVKQAGVIPFAINIPLLGGVIVIVTRQFFGTPDVYKEDFLPLCQQLQANKKWHQVEISDIDNFLDGVKGQKIIFQVGLKPN